MELIIVIVSAVIFCALVWAAISVAIALARLADEAAKLRRILGILAETQLSRGDNEIAAIQAAHGLVESIHLAEMPHPQRETDQSRRAAKIDTIMRQ